MALCDTDNRERFVLHKLKHHRHIIGVYQEVGEQKTHTAELSNVTLPLGTKYIVEEFILFFC